MSRMDYNKAKRCDLWKEQARQPTAEHLIARKMAERPCRPATKSQLFYLQSLLPRCGRRELTETEASALTIMGASRLIATLKELLPA